MMVLPLFIRKAKNITKKQLLILNKRVSTTLIHLLTLKMVCKCAAFFDHLCYLLKDKFCYSFRYKLLYLLTARQVSIKNCCQSVAGIKEVIYNNCNFCLWNKLLQLTSMQMIRGLVSFSLYLKATKNRKYHFIKTWDDVLHILNAALFIIYSLW